MIRLRGVAWEHPRGIGGIRAASAAWERGGAGVGIEWEPRTLLSFGDTPIIELAEGRDLLIVDHPNLSAGVADGAVLPLEDLVEDELDALRDRFVGPSFASYLVDGRVAALPVDAAAQVSAFRPDLLCAPPASWAEVLELAADGRVLLPSTAIDAFSSLCTLLAQAGDPLVSPGGAPADDESLASALGLLRRLVESGPRSALDLNPIAAADELADGERYAYSPLLFGYTNYSRRGFRRHRIAYRDIPEVERGGGLLGGAGIAVSARSRHPRLAARAAVALASADLQQGPWFDGGGQPARVEAWDDPALDAATCGFFSGTRRTIESAWVRPADVGWPVVQSRVAALVAGHLRGGIADEIVVSGIHAAVEGLRERADAGR